MTGSGGNVAVLLINGIGDQLIAWPAIRALEALFPGRLKMILGRGMSFMFYRDVPFRDHFWVDWADPARHQIDVGGIAPRVGGCEVFVNLCEWLSPSVCEFIRRTQPRLSVGFGDAYDLQVKVGDEVHMFDRIFAIPRQLDDSLKLEDFAARPSFHPAAEAAARKLASRHLEDGQKIFVVHPETRERKMWSQNGYSYVLRHFLADHPDYVAFLCSKKPFPIEAGAFSARVVTVQSHLELVLALIGRADLFLGIDSCLLHAADLYRVPGVALFSPTPAAMWGFRFSSPGLSVCHPDSMNSIRPEAVLESLVRAVQSPTSGADESAFVEIQQGKTGATFLKE